MVKLPLLASQIGEATASRIADGEATASRIADGEATASRIADGEATASRIADGAGGAFSMLLDTRGFSKKRTYKKPVYILFVHFASSLCKQSEQVEKSDGQSE